MSAKPRFDKSSLSLASKNNTYSAFMLAITRCALFFLYFIRKITAYSIVVDGTNWSLTISSFGYSSIVFNPQNNTYSEVTQRAFCLVVSFADLAPEKYGCVLLLCAVVDILGYEECIQPLDLTSFIHVTYNQKP